MGQVVHEDDGSVWEVRSDGERVRLGGPGSDRHQQRWAGRTLPVIDLAMQLARRLRGDLRPGEPPVGTRDDAMDQLLDLADRDGHVLAEAALFLERVARTRGDSRAVAPAELLEECRSRLNVLDLPPDVATRRAEALRRGRGSEQ